MLRISWKEHKSNDFVNNQIGSRVTLCQKIDKIKLQYFGHIARREGDNLDKIIAQGHVEGKRKSVVGKILDGVMVSERSQDWMLAKPIAMRYAQDRDGWNVIIGRLLCMRFMQIYVWGERLKNINLSTEYLTDWSIK